MEKQIKVTSVITALRAIALCGHIRAQGTAFVNAQMERVADSGLALDEKEVKLAYMSGILGDGAVAAEQQALQMKQRSEEGQKAYWAANSFYTYWFNGGKETKASATTGPFAKFAKGIQAASKLTKAQQKALKDELETVFAKYGITM